MIVRVYDSSTGTYFKSEVYAKINLGWHEKYLVRISCSDGDYLRLYDFLDKEVSPPVSTLINQITTAIPSDWIVRESGTVDKNLDGYPLEITDGINLFSYHGFPWLYDDKATMIKLLHGESIPVRGSIFENSLIDKDEHEEGWHYIEGQEDIDFIMEQTSSFHDSILKSISYVSGGYVDGGRFIFLADYIRTATFIIDSQLSASVEIVFEGVTAMNLRPAGDNFDEFIYSASLYIKDCTVFFCGDTISSFDTSYQGTWITSYRMKWRFA